MDATTQRVIKADNVNLDGQVQLGLNVTAGAKPKDGASAEAGGPGAFIVEKNSQYMIVEITCTCGKKTYLRCEFS
jgi:hypothetical protein